MLNKVRESKIMSETKIRLPSRTTGTAKMAVHLSRTRRAKVLNRRLTNSVQRPPPTNLQLKLRKELKPNL